MWYRVTEEEAAQHKEKAEAAGLSVSSLIRDHLGRVSIRSRKDERRIQAALAGIRGSMNQTAKWANIHKGKMEAVAVISALVNAERAMARLADELAAER